MGHVLDHPRTRFWTTYGRRLLFGWIRTHLDPASEGASALGAMSLPRQLGVVEGRLTVGPADELLLARQSRLDFPLTHHAETTLSWGARSAGELVLDAECAAAVGGITLHGSSRSLRIDCSLFPGPGELRVFWDTGIVEVFGGGLVGAWSDLALADVESVRIEHRAGAGGSATLWTLGRLAS